MSKRARGLVWLSSLLVIFGAIALIVVAIVVDKDHPLSTLSPVGRQGRDIAELINPIFIVAGVVFFLVQGAVLALWWRFRVAGSDSGDGEFGYYEDDEFPDQTHGNNRLEIAWTIVPTVLLAVISVFTLVALFALDDVKASDEDLVVTVIGQQWWWEYQYHLDGDTDTAPDFVTANELVIPVGVDVALDIKSRDVIHSFWIPKLNGKRDAVPGRSHDWVIQAEEPGRFRGQCTEFCGLSHGYMKMVAVALPRAEFAQWRDNQITPADMPEEGTQAGEGWATFSQQCANCHVINGVTSAANRGGDPESAPDTWDIYGEFNGPHAGTYTDELVAGAAPNLTHLMTRTTFAGSAFDLYLDAGDDIPYLVLSDKGTLNRGELEAWIFNAPERKPADADDLRGMPARTGLSPDDIDNVVAFLSTLD
ncbi:MAG: cytochrome c oxidase subunit II [Acidimicrobiia bacterium]|nr:cytochrome c oxidase subunit II [Acidimicrobiia bacterium]MYG71675.1 cytochrome c oxidase subunit II [Acidimicrobiia bacterium]